MEQNYKGYNNGVSLGGLFVIEDWMFKSDTKSAAYPKNQNNHQWSQSLTASKNYTYAYATYDCHLNHYLSDDDLADLAAFGYNAVRLPIGYWVFDHPDLYPGDTWVARPGGHASAQAHGGNDPLSDYGVNPDGFVTSGTRP